MNFQHPILMSILMATLVLAHPVVVSPVQYLRELAAAKTTEPPSIDGRGDDPAWQSAVALTVRDKVSDTPITLKAVYTDKDVFWLVTFPDDAPDWEQKTLVWDARAGRYQTSPKREDTFVFKWAMDADTSDLSIEADRSYRADIWYWKAARTDPAGYADDKLHIYSSVNQTGAKKMLSRSGRTFYLKRSGDAGLAAYELMVYPSYQDDELPKFKVRQPSGSRADIRAKGGWREGAWTVEFQRALHTGQADDVQFDTSKRYLFGVSRYEIAGRSPDPSLAQPYFGAGDVGEHMHLIFDAGI